MADSPLPPRSSSSERAPDDRLESWKEIAAYLKRDATTVQRWEKREAMPVHRHVHAKLGSVYAFRSELDAWDRSRRPVEGSPPAWNDAAAVDAGSVRPGGGEASVAGRSPLRRRAWLAMGLAAALVAVSAAWLARGRITRPANPLADARYVQLTDFDGAEEAAAISRDGHFVAFQSDRDGRMDVWTTQIGTGEFVNLTRGAARDFANPQLRGLGFSPDGTLVTYWSRGGSEGKERSISVWGIPLLGGAPRVYLEGAAEYDWSSDGALVFHTPGPGDPLFVRDAGSSEARHVFSAPAGQHGHFLVWSPDRAFVYFVLGSLPDRLDLWRIRPAGGAPERITHHDARVSHPVFVDDRTLLYLATDADGLGPFIHGIDVEERVPRRLTSGVDSYTSLAASGDGLRLVASRASPKSTLWRVPLDGARVDLSKARRVPLTTGSGSLARLGPGFLLYVASKGTSDSLWKVQDGAAAELWSGPPEARITGAPAISRDGARVAFPVRRDGRTMLYVIDADGTDARVVERTLDLHGAPAWAPDGRSITVAGVVDGAPRLFTVALDGRAPARLRPDHSVDPQWSPGGELVVFSGPDVGTTFPLVAAKPDGTAHAMPALTLTRGARHVAFLPGGRSLIVLRGELHHKDLWTIDLDTGAARRLTELGPEFELRDFDVSPDGRELVLEQVLGHSDLVLIERQRR